MMGLFEDLYKYREFLKTNVKKDIAIQKHDIPF